MPAILVHHTDTVDKPWDANKNEKRLRTGEKESYYRKMYAWQDPDANPETKSAYKFPHHEVDADGNIGPVNVRGCITGIAVLNGAMGGADIPERDRKGVWEHLAAHLKDAKIEPTELKSFIRPKEIRMLDVTAVVEPVEEEQAEMIVEGYAIRFNEPAIFTLNGVEYREIIDSRALDKTDMSDVPLKYNHSDHVMIMARTRNKTLQLIKDERGLKIRAKLANTTAGRDLYELIKRGDIDKMSFAFTVRKDDYNKETRTRTILDIEKIFDVSAVDLPAYDTTSIYARSFALLESEAKALESAEKRRRLYLLTYTI
jgi:hypothetical protein